MDSLNYSGLLSVHVSSSPASILFNSSFPLSLSIQKDSLVNNIWEMESSGLTGIKSSLGVAIKAQDSGLEEQFYDQKWR